MELPSAKWLFLYIFQKLKFYKIVQLSLSVRSPWKGMRKFLYQRIQVFIKIEESLLPKLQIFFENLAFQPTSWLFMFLKIPPIYLHLIFAILQFGISSLFLNWEKIEFKPIGYFFQFRGTEYFFSPLLPLKREKKCILSLS